MHNSVDLFIYIYIYMCVILILMSTPWINKVTLPYLTLPAESFNEYFVNIGPSLASAASEEPLTQHTTNSYNNSNPTTDTISISIVLM
jgi:hypothetical protein